MAETFSDAAAVLGMPHILWGILQYSDPCMLRIARCCGLACKPLSPELSSSCLRRWCVSGCAIRDLPRVNRALNSSCKVVRLVRYSRYDRRALLWHEVNRIIAFLRIALVAQAVQWCVVLDVSCHSNLSTASLINLVG